MTLNLRTTQARWDVEIDIGPTAPLTQVDLRMLSEVSRDRPQNYKQNPLKRLTERHHALARVIAAGTPNAQAAIITGYTRETIVMLKDDPSFQELIDFYSQELNTEYLGMHAQMAGLGADAIQELRRRVEEDPEGMGAGFLLDLVTKLADRTGYGPTTKTESTSVNVSIDLSARMKAARERARVAIEGSARDITPEAET